MEYKKPALRQVPPLWYKMSISRIPMTNSGLSERSHAALLAGARAACSAAFDDRGYLRNYEQNLIADLPLDAIVEDLAEGAGQELDSKLRAAHSSTALVVNTFGPWRSNPRTLHLHGVSGFLSMSFEAKCPTGLSGTPPHLDLLAIGDLPVAVESKCTEWMKPTRSKFVPAYDNLRVSHGRSPWFAQIERLRQEPDRYKYLDAAQLVKHALGLRTRFGTSAVLLLYLFWEPRNSQDWPECRAHRDEADDLARRVAQSNIRLIPVSYRELWEEWERSGPPAHLSLLRLRYDRDA
jgi:hypothetical protein